MSSGTPERTCPECGKGDIETAGTVATFNPRPVRDLSDLNRGRKVIEKKFRCRECGHKFSEIEEVDF